MTKVVVPLKQASHWILGLTPTTAADRSAICATRCNALRHAPEWRGVLAFDEFTARVITQNPLPWGERVADACPCLRMDAG